MTVHDAPGSGASAGQLLGDADRRARKGAAARLAIEANRGALARLLRLIDTAVSEAGRRGYSPGRGAPGGGLA